LKAARRILVDAEPVEQEVRRVGGGAHRRNPRHRTLRRSGKRGGGNGHQRDRANAVRHRPMRDEEMIEIRGGAEADAGQRQAVTRAAEERSPRRGCAPNAVPRHQIGGPRRGKSGQGMANRTRHSGQYHRRFCDLPHSEAKVAGVVTC